MNHNKISLETIQDKLWAAAESLRGNLSAEEYMHVVIGIIFLKYTNDKNALALHILQTENGLQMDQIEASDLKAKGAFVVQQAAKWEVIFAKADTEAIGAALDAANAQLQKDNQELAGIFTESYNNPKYNKTRLGEVVRIFNTINLSAELGEDIFGRIYEYFLGEFFLKRGQKGGEFYTPKSLVQLMTMFLKPEKGKIYDPCCGTGGMLVQAKQYLVENHQKVEHITVYGQEFNSTTWKIAKLNLLLNGLNIMNEYDGQKEWALGLYADDTFTNDQHKGKKFDYILANPPFNYKKYWQKALEGDPRWVYGKPPANNANYAWIQHILSKLNKGGQAAVILANGSLTSTIKGEKHIRQALVDHNKISCILTLPDKLFYTTAISATIWFFHESKPTDLTLMIDAQKMGQPIPGSSNRNELSPDNLKELTNLYEQFLQKQDINIPGLAKTVTKQEIIANDYLLTPGRYIDLPPTATKDPAVIQQELKQAITELQDLFAESAELEQSVLAAIKKLDLE